MRWRAAQYPTEAILGVAFNPVRCILNEVGRIAGLNYVVQVVLDGRGGVVRVIAGDPIAADRASTTTSFQVYAVDVPTRADIVVADARLDDADLFQAAKALYAASLAVRPRGTVVLVAACPEGVGPTHPLARWYGIKPIRDIEADVSLEKIADVVAASFLAMVSRALQERGACYLVSRHFSAAEASCLGFHLAGTPREALDQARQDVGNEASVLVLRQATAVFPRI